MGGIAAVMLSEDKVIGGKKVIVSKADMANKLELWEFQRYHNITDYWEYKLESDMNRDKLAVFKAMNEARARLWFITNYVVPFSWCGCYILTSKQAANPLYGANLATLVLRREQTDRLKIGITDRHKPDPDEVIFAAGEDLTPLDRFFSTMEVFFGKYFDATARWLYGR